MKTQDNHPFFREPVFCDLFAENLRLCKVLKGFRLSGWVLAYDHFHLLVQPSDRFNVSRVMQFLKRHVTRDINWLTGHDFEGAIRESRLQNGRYERFEPIIRRHDELLKKLKSQFADKYPQNPFPRFEWQKSYHDHYIRGDRDFHDKLGYMKYNLIKHHLPANWPYVYTNPGYRDLLDDL